MHRSRITAYLQRLESLRRLHCLVLNRSGTVSSRPKLSSVFPFLDATIYDAHHLSMVRTFYVAQEHHACVVLSTPKSSRQETRRAIGHWETSYILIGCNA